MFYYYRKPGGALIRLPDAPMDSPKFLKAYAAAEEAGAAEVRKRTEPIRSVSELVRRYLTSRRFTDLRRSTQEVRQRIMLRIDRKAGHLAWSSLARRHIQKDIDDQSPGAAGHRLTAWKDLARIALRLEWTDIDITQGIELPRYKKQPHARWTAEDCAAFEEHWPLGTLKRTAYELFRETGCRRGDAVRMGWRHVQDGWLCWTQQKTREPVEIPVSARLAEALSHCDRSAETFLAVKDGALRSDNAFGAWFGAAAKAAGIAKTAHGLRHDFGARVAEAGMDATAGAAALGHTSTQQTEGYRKQASRRQLAEKVMRKLETGQS